MSRFFAALRLKGNLMKTRAAVLYEAKEAGRNRVRLDTFNAIVPMANRLPRLLRQR